ncbi:hypothetical protein SAMN05216388_1003342 [Halorientalis persicus]|jgi:hypothetical protein|uniref:Uncharacterized protein n=1 Tax=Halorientalis persicus TaxID=1367881 RepID=A0A1H8HCW5_9EURY|nr:hypothetical protein [Halorientalis persicus]SEN53707.1 hypothetical protein SAMN05216388_1003342 [Halorientalis persicus]
MAKQVAGQEATSVANQLTDASNILVLAPSFPDGAAGVCVDLLGSDDPSEASVLGVTYTQSPGKWGADYERETGGPPADGTVISVGDWGADVGTGTSEWTLEAVEHAGDLTALGVTLSEHLAPDASGRQRLCFDSLTALLQFVELQRAFQFLHVVTGRVSAAGAVGHYHLDPQAHDEQTLATIRGLFDAVVEVDERGEWTITSR